MMPEHKGRERLRELLRARASRTQVVVALLVALVGFSAATQIRQDEADSLDRLTQTELVRLLDEIGTRIDDLSAERDSLRAELAELRTGVTSQEAARAAAEQQVLVRSIQAGVVPVHGPGIVVTIEDPRGVVRAQSLVTLIEELRNAGAEAIQLNSIRISTRSWVVQAEEGVEVDGLALAPPYRVTAIGSPDSLSVALEMPGGVL
ncbi:MAG: DUF881 domain-containing protein, partial [Actinomycetes bacterium]|nr:DUF881 domain-containing protein [Actinomycetes bacterium]MDX5380574.1 DUF881 domain-containing protein [Actinomycetes bacterium]MDX5450316.1 DUF881 domain-containing protein [Actinomycetes bacterium]